MKFGTTIESLKVSSPLTYHGISWWDQKNQAFEVSSWNKVGEYNGSLCVGQPTKEGYIPEGPSLPWWHLESHGNFDLYISHSNECQNIRTSTDLNWKNSIAVYSRKSNIMGLRENIDVKSKHQSQKGSRATLFVFVMAALETMTFSSNAVSLFNYFHGYMNFSLTKSATAVTNYMGTAFLLSLFGGFISDTYISRFNTCVITGCLQVMGYGLLAVQAHFKQLRPFPCKDVKMSQCESATSSQQAMLFACLYIVALGSGGSKAALPSLGADQFDERDQEAASLASYFNWFMFFVNLGAIFGVTFVVWINTNQGWDWAFGVCSIAVAIAVLFLTSGRSFYWNNIPTGSPLTRILQVFVAAIRNRNLPLPDRAEELHKVRDKEGQQTEILQRTDQFRFLDHAAIVRPSEDSSSSTTGGSWKMCTVTQVEETKILVRMLPIILSTIFMNTCLAQLQTFTIQQSTITNRKIGSFEIPASSIPVIPLVFMFILIPLYDQIFVPLARKFTGIPTGITQLQRVGIGLILSAVSMAVSGIIETHRKKVAGEHKMVDSPEPLAMSVFWLGIQYAIFGVADIFTMVGMLNFFYSESSSGMKSLGTAISWCSFSFGYYTSTVVVNVVNKVSGGWLASNNLNRDRLEYFYWLLAGLSVVNFGIYLLCASWYKYKKVEVKQVDSECME